MKPSQNSWTTKRRLLPHALFLVLALATGLQSARATHLRAGEITVTRKSCNSLEFTITITVYTNTASPILFSDGGSGLLSFGDGTSDNPPQQENTPVPGFGPEFGYVSFSIDHTFQGPGTYTISYFEHNRNAGILNMVNSVDTPFYVESVITIDAMACNNSPKLLIPPINKACTGVAWFHNPGAYDPDGDSLSFALTPPLQDLNSPVFGYSNPNASEFYGTVGIDYNTANETHNGLPVFAINPTTGTVTWDAPGTPGEYTIALVVKEWRKTSGTWVEIGYVTRDMQIIVEDCANLRPLLTPPADLCVEAGALVNANIFGTDPDHDSVKIEAFSQVFSISNSPATFSPFPAVFQATTTTNATANFTWSTLCEHIRLQAYQIVFRETDFPPPATGTALANFKTWSIRVAGPSPQGISVQPLSGGKAKIQWNNYACGSATSMQVWRRVNSYPFTPSACFTGMPDFLGFTMIADVPIGTTEYTDTNGGKGLAPGALYCYRLVAAFPQPDGGESYASEESCFSMLATAPVITKVSVAETGPIGQTTIQWTSPFDVNQVIFPPPYQYALYRADGFSGDASIAQVFQAMITDTVYVDNVVNTEERVYNYRVVAFSNGIMVDTSATASSVRLELTPHNENIELNWSAEVPWSNRNIAYPYHRIYRGPENSTFHEMQLVDSVNVNENGLHYADSGQWNHTALSDTQMYCYCVGTFGAYGNMHINEPISNLSQIACVKLGEVTGVLVSESDVVQLYPNPVIDYFMVKGIQGEAGNASVVDLVGRSMPVVLEKNQDALRVDVRFLADGMYIFKVNDKNTVHQIKFIKQ